MKNTFRLGTAIFLMAAVYAAHGFNLNYLKFSPVRDFTEQDWKMAKAATRQALEKTEVGEAVSWENPETGNSGESKTIKVYSKGKILCKDVEIINRSQTLEGKARYGFCKQSDGEWKVDSK